MRSSFHNTCKSNHYSVYLKLLQVMCQLYLNKARKNIYINNKKEVRPVLWICPSCLSSFSCKWTQGVRKSRHCHQLQVNTTILRPLCGHGCPLKQQKKTYWLHYFPRVAVTNYHKPGRSKQQKFIPLVTDVRSPQSR